MTSIYAIEKDARV